MNGDDILGSDLLAVVAHDLKAPISAVRGYIELIQRAGDLNPLQLKYCDRAMGGLERMEGLINALLEMARLEQGEALKYEDCNLETIIRSAVDLVESLAEQKAVAIHVSLDDDLDVVRGDRGLLGQVFNNLLTNAIKYNRNGGSIQVTASNQSDFVRIDVRDDGVGIPESDQPHVFELFFRAGNSAKTRAAGSGLGLAIAKAIIQKHEGYIWVNSVEGEGSTFSFTIPRKGRLNEGADTLDESARDIGESSDNHRHSYHEASIEEPDGIDDNTQESRGSKEIDSSSDAV